MLAQIRKCECLEVRPPKNVLPLYHMNKDLLTQNKGSSQTYSISFPLPPLLIIKSSVFMEVYHLALIHLTTSVRWTASRKCPTKGLCVICFGLTQMTAAVGEYPLEEPDTHLGRIFPKRLIIIMASRWWRGPTSWWWRVIIGHRIVTLLLYFLVRLFYRSLKVIYWLDYAV